MKSDTLSWKDKNTINAIKKAFSQGHVLVGTSDTVIGLLAPIEKKSFQLLNEIKQRKNKPYLILIGSKKSLIQFVKTPLNLQTENLIRTVWPGPVTIIFNAKENLPAYLTSSEKKIALRMPDHKGLQELLQEYNGLFSTSANKTEKPIPISLNMIDQDILKKVAFAINDDKQENRPSTILDCTGEQIKVVRKGVYPIEKLENMTGQKFFSK